MIAGSPEDEVLQLEAAIAALEGQRAVLGGAVVDPMIAAAREKLGVLLSRPAMAVQRKQVTVLFADLVSFSALTASMDPEDVHEIMSAYFDRLDGVIDRYGGDTEKYIGDAVMAVFGLHTSSEIDPANAVRAGLAMQQSITQLNQDLAGKHGIQLAVRVGINTGLALVAFPGKEDQPFQVVGDTVNIAARLEATSPAAGIVISQATYNQIRGLFDVQPRSPLILKDRPESIQAYRVLRAKPRTFYMPARGLADVVTRTVGRDSELQVLRNAYVGTLAGQGMQWITVTGEAGVGKSRLLAEFENWIELRSETVWYLKARAWSHTQHGPYSVLRDLLSFRFEISDSDAMSVAQNKLTDGLSRVLGESLGAEAAAFVGQLLGFDFSHSPWIAHIRNDTRQIRGRATVLLRQYLDKLCAIRPAVLFLEDLHWADEESLALLVDLLTEPQSWRLLVIGAGRPAFWERDHFWGLDALGTPLAHHSRLDLEPLTDEATLELVQELLQKVDQPPDWLVELLIERGTGNPYFLEELVHWLMDQGVIDAGWEAWRVRQDRPAGLSVPGTIQGVLQGRLERLSQQERSALQQAAVVGRVFWDGAVQYIGDGPVSPGVWEHLQQRDLVLHQAKSQLPGQQEYHFKHALLHDLVYEYTLRKQRRFFHQRASEWLERVVADRLDEWAAVIAAHCEQAGDGGKAASWYGRAGQQAQATHAPDSAIGYYRLALALLRNRLAENDPAQQLPLYRGLGEMLHWQARYEEAAEAYQSMRALGEESGDLTTQAQAWNLLSWVQDSLGDYRASQASAQRAETIAQKAGPPAEAELARALYSKGWSYYRLGDAETASRLGHQALALNTERGDRHEMANSMNLLAGTYNLLGRFAEGDIYNRGAVALYQELGDRERVSAMLNNLGEHARLIGDYETASARYRAALSIANEIGDRNGQLLVSSNLGGALVGMGQFQEAEQILRRLIESIEVAGQGGELSESYRFLAEACLGQGQVGEALPPATAALEKALQMAAQESIGNAWRTLGMVAARCPQGVTAAGSRYNAVDCFAASLRVCVQAGMEGERARTLRAWANYEFERGDRERGMARWQEARGILEQLGMEAEVARMVRAEEEMDGCH